LTARFRGTVMASPAALGQSLAGAAIRNKFCRAAEKLALRF
jgi:hypothetical protein